jgi:LPS export ABC transporter protein LptC
VIGRTLPVLALVVAAACENAEPIKVGQTNPLADSADQVLFGVRHNVANAGLLRAKLLSDTAFIFDEGTRIELVEVDLTFFTTTGVKNAVLTSRTGTYRTRVGAMEARDDVLVVSEDGRRLTTEQLRYDPNRNQISSDSAFVLTEPGGRRLEGVGFVSDPDMNNIRILQDVGGQAGVVSVPGGDTTTAPSGGPASIVPPPVRPPVAP